MNNRMKTKITAQDIADYLISYAQSKDIKITPLEVQKYLFYAQGWHLAVSDSVLFDDKFEAWTHGPVIKKIYGRFKKFERNNIDEKIEMPEIPIDIMAFLKKFVIDQYFHVSSSELWKMVHNEEAYKIARGTLPEDKPSNSELDESIMYKSFKERYKEDTFDENEIDDIDDELLNDICESLNEFRRGEVSSYEEVFGHPQPGF